MFQENLIDTVLFNRSFAGHWLQQKLQAIAKFCKCAFATMQVLITNSVGLDGKSLYASFAASQHTLRINWLKNGNAILHRGRLQYVAFAT